MTDLKPCPFCGVVPDIGDRKSVQCTNKRCRLILAVTFSITDWNTRAEDAPDPDCPACEGHGVVATTKSDLDGNYIETSCPKCADIVEKPDDKEVREAVEVAKDLYPDSDSVETLVLAATAKCDCEEWLPIEDAPKEEKSFLCRSVDKFAPIFQACFVWEQETIDGIAHGKGWWDLYSLSHDEPIDDWQRRYVWMPVPRAAHKQKDVP